MDKQQITQELSKYNITDALISELKQKYSGLTIKGLEDKEGYKLVHEARMDLRDKRVAVEKTRKELKADSLEYGRMVDAEAKRITGLLEPLELELAKQEEIIDNEKKRIKEEAERKTQEVLNHRITELAQYGAAHDVNGLKMMDDTSFSALLTHHKGLYEAEQEKKRLEAEAAKLEQERLAKEREELDKQKAEQDRIAAELKAKQDALDKEKREHEAKIQAEKDAEKKKIQEQHLRALGAQQERERIEKEQKDKEAQKALEELKAKRAEALKPDKEKIAVFAKTIREMAPPTVRHDEAAKLLLNFQKCINQCCESIINESKNL